MREVSLTASRGEFFFCSSGKFMIIASVFVILVPDSGSLLFCGWSLRIMGILLSQVDADPDAASVVGVLLSLASPAKEANAKLLEHFSSALEGPGVDEFAWGSLQDFLADDWAAELREVARELKN